MTPRVSLLLCFLCAAPIARAAACPQNNMAGDGQSVFSSLAVDERTLGNTSERYNVPKGTLGLTLKWPCSRPGECGTSASVYVEDDFSLYGLPPGTPVALTVHLAGDLEMSAGGFYNTNTTASLRDALGHEVVGSLTPTTFPRHYDVSLPVAAIAGQPFRLHFELSGYALNIAGGGDGVFSFTGVPPGAAVTSCQGYVSDLSVPVTARTWGALKRFYR